MMCEPPLTEIRRAVAAALAEDLTPLGDLTSALLDADLVATARFVPREDGRLAGRGCAAEAFAQIDDRVEMDWSVSDGDELVAGTPFCDVSGPLRSILTAERTALNFLGHLSGVATMTARYAAAASVGGEARVWDTRKTTPGLRSLEKAAVRAGGGRNHRGNLSDWVLLKDNHITGMGITAAVERCHDVWPARTCHVECDTEDQMVEAITAGAEAVLLDNMTPAGVAACVARATELCGGDADARRRTVLLEVSGGVTLDTIGEYSATGVDQISVGRITNSAPCLDIGLDIDAR